MKEEINGAVGNSKLVWIDFAVCFSVLNILIKIFYSKCEGKKPDSF